MQVDWSNSARARGIRWGKCALLAAILVTAFALCTTAPRVAAENTPPHAVADRSGEIAAGTASAFILAADLGSVQIRTVTPDANPMVRYSVHLETDARQPSAQALLDKYSLTARQTPNGILLSSTLPFTRKGPNRNAQFWVQFVVTVPANFSVEVTTGAGDIETSDIGGRVVLLTEGGNIRTGKIGFALVQMNAAMISGGRIEPLGGTMREHRGYRGRGRSADVSDTEPPAAKVETKGGHITLLDVSGDVDAYTAGGHIQAGNIAGNASLRTGGGHIRAGQIKGTARLETEGGNIAVGEAGSLVSVRTGGGQIDFGEVHGSVRAQTGGGGIRVMYVAGPMEVETSGGSICLTRVVNTVRAATGTGTITAWIAPDSHDTQRWVKLPGPSQLASSSGDIVVFVPRNLAATIDALVEAGNSASIEADPSLTRAMTMQSPQQGQIHAVGMLNGGGSTLRLRTATGKIRLKYIDEEMPLRQSLLEEQRQRLATKLGEAIELSGATSMDSSQETSPQASPEGVSSEAKGDWFYQVRNRLEIAILGGVREDPEEFKKRLINSPPPEYPQIAQRAGLQGLVRLQVRVKTDGTLVVEKVLEGEPALVDEASAAVRQWRANPEMYGGKKVDVISVVTFNFQLR
jgi:TonB family protein